MASVGRDGGAVLWSITAAASGDRELTREEIVELADAVAGDSGVASGIGTTSYGVRLIVEAADRAGALEAGRAAFLAAAERAGLPRWPITHARALAEGEDDDDGDDGDDLGTEGDPIPDGLGVMP